jgi:hypothetical protein
MFAVLFAVLGVAAPPEPLQVREPTINAGEARIGPMLVRRFAFVNTGREPLTITELTASCGCLSPALPQRTYRPGERGELALEVNTLSQPAGPNRWTVRVGYRCGEQAGAATLELTAKLVKEINITPASLVFHGSDPPSNVIQILASHRESEPPPRRLIIRDLRTSSPRLTASCDLNESESHGPPGESVIIWSSNIFVRVSEQCPAGEFAETVTIVTDDPDYREIRVPVTIRKTAKRRVTALPPRATLVAGGSAVVQLRDADGKPVQVEAIDSGLPALTTRWAVGPGNVTTVRVGLDRSKWRGEALAGELRVRLREPVGEVVVIPVAVRVGEE